MRRASATGAREGVRILSAPALAWAAFAAAAFAPLALAGAVWHGYARYAALEARVTELEFTLASTTKALSDEIITTNTALSEALRAQGKSVAAVREQLGGFENRVGSITGTVSTLEKLSKLDPELLAKYSKVFFLNENYEPSDLAEIPPEHRYLEDRDLRVLARVRPYLLNLLTQAKSDGVELYVVSAYRSFGSQGELKKQYTVVYGSGANQFSADQGYSEHQLGTTIDLITTGLGGELTERFGETAAYRWLEQNAYRYGFVLSYPKGNGYYLYEPWHWRFVGTKLATDLHEAGKHFYDLDQRTLDTYLVSIFD